jgi:hypothetical protein
MPIPDPLRAFRRVLAAILVIGLLGSAVELLLLKHTDGVWQLLPLLLIGASLLGLAWHVVAPGRASLRALQALMLLSVLSGIAGVLLHYRGNVAWELERMPGTHGWELFRHAVMGATPSLAPGTMLQLGLVGLLFTYRHPALRRQS